MGDWEIDAQDEDINAIKQICDFKCKSYLDGLINNVKAQFYARGYQQLEIIKFLETYAPMFQCKMFLSMLPLNISLGLKSKQGGVTAAFLHEYIG